MRYVDLVRSRHRKDKNKGWVLLFTFAIYRTIHLELIQSLFTNSFLLGFRRFIAQQRRPKKIYTDNRTNFFSTNNLIICFVHLIRAFELRMMYLHARVEVILGKILTKFDIFESKSCSRKFCFEDSIKIPSIATWWRDWCKHII